ncbi:MAG: Ig-like domain-containing protein [Erysipelotrichaceae bacterium]|nr:Ig-like domain-containing protein [Erysipelotrichaceae bacterium]
MRKLLALLMIVLMLAGCTKKPEETVSDLGGKTFYDTADAYGSKDHSKVWFGKDGSFVFTDNSSTGPYDISGSWSVKENVCTLEATDGFSGKIIFELQEDGTMVLKTGLSGSRSGDSFTTDESKGYSSGEDSGSGKKDDGKEDASNDIPCTAIFTEYSNYWAEEGTKSWHLNIKPIPENTTDKMTYKSNDESIVTIDENGNVATGKPGKTTIEVTCGSQKITVGFETRSNEITEIKPEKDKIVTKLGNPEEIKVKVVPETADTKGLTYTSSDPEIVKVDSGNKIYAKHPGVATITIKAPNGVSATVDVCVEGATMDSKIYSDTVKGGSGEYIYFDVYKTVCENWNVTYTDLRLMADIHVSDPILKYDNKGRLWADPVSADRDVEVYFTFEDEDLYPEVSSETYTIHVTK